MPTVSRYRAAARPTRRRAIAYIRPRRLTAAEVETSDYVLVMDGKNLRDSYLITNGRFADKISKLGAYSGAGDIIDPWYSRDFSRTYAEIDAACDAFLSALERNGRI